MSYHRVKCKWVSEKGEQNEKRREAVLLLISTSDEGKGFSLFEAAWGWRRGQASSKSVCACACTGKVKRRNKKMKMFSHVSYSSDMKTSGVWRQWRSSQISFQLVFNSEMVPYETNWQISWVKKRRQKVWTTILCYFHGYLLSLSIYIMIQNLFQRFSFVFVLKNPWNLK